MHLIRRYLDILKETALPPLHRSPMSMGLETMTGDGFALVGGFRSGSSPPGRTRCRYMIYDTEVYRQTRDEKQAKLGTVDLFLDTKGAICALVDIKLNPKNRRAGLGSAIVKSLVATSSGDLTIYDIKKTAVGFWRKMGAELTGSTKTNGATGVIRKSGAATSVTESAITPIKATLDSVTQQKEAWLPGLIKIMDERSIANILEIDHGPEELASAWFDSCMAIYQHIQRIGKCPVYRHMMVDDFRSFIRSLKNGAGRLGEHWSIHYGIESPTWKQDQRGDVPISIEGEITASQIDWEATLRQNFEWPHEFELIFSGDVLVKTVEDQDTDNAVRLNARFPR